MIPVITLYTELAINFAKDPLLKELNFPICECLTAYLTIYTKVTYYPLILHCIEQLIVLMENTRIRFSICKNLIDLIKTKHLKVNKNGSKNKIFEFEIQSRISKEHLIDNSFWLRFSEKVLYLLERYFLMIADEPYFPSLVNSIQKPLRSLLKRKISIEIKKNIVKIVF